MDDLKTKLLRARLDEARRNEAAATSAIKPIEPTTGEKALSYANTAMRSGASGMTYGHSDELGAGLGALVDTGSAALGLRGDIDLKDAYKTRLEATRADDKAAREANPKTAFVSEMTGAVLPMTLGGPAAIAKAPGLFGAGTAARSVGMATTGGAIAGSGYSEADSLGGYAKDVGLGAGLGLATLGIGKTAGKAIGKVDDALGVSDRAKKAAIWAYVNGKNAAKTGGKKLLSAVGGVSEDNIDNYLANSGRINAARPFDALQDDAAIALESLAKKTSAAKEGASTAQRTQRDAERAYVDQLKAVDVPDTVPGQINEAIGGLRKSVSEGSGKAFDVARAADQSSGVGPLKGYLSQRMNQLKIGDAVPDSPEFRVLAKYREFLDQTNLKEMRPEDLKRFVQMIDEDAAESYAKLKMPGGRLSAGDKALLDYRRFVNEYLTELPGYSEVMKPLAGKVKTLNSAMDVVGDDRQTHRLLKNIDDPLYAKERGALEGLGKETSQDFFAPLKPYQEAQRTLGDRAALEAGKAALPESAAAKRAAQEAADMDLWAEPLTGLTPNNAFAALKTAGTRQEVNPEALERIKYLGELAGKDLLQEAKDYGVQRSFTLDNTRGSKNVNLMGSVGGATMGGISGLLGTDDPSIGGISSGIAGGAALGAINDRYGTRATKKILDKVISSRTSGPELISKLTAVLERIPEKLGPYAGVLQKAKERGEAALGGTHEIMMKHDPEYGQFIRQFIGGQ